MFSKKEKKDTLPDKNYEKSKKEFLDFDKIVKKDFYKKRKLYNWGGMCYFWRKNTF